MCVWHGKQPKIVSISGYFKKQYRIHFYPSDYGAVGGRRGHIHGAVAEWLCSGLQLR